MPATQIDRIDGLTTSVAVKAPVRVVATSPITFQGASPYGYQTIDGVAVTDNISTPDKFPDRVLLVGQSDARQNGIWQVSSLSWTRALDFDGARDAVEGTMIYVNEGTLFANSTWKLRTANPIFIGTTALAFTEVFTPLTGPTLSFATTAALLSATWPSAPSDGFVAITGGRSSKGDGGDAAFYYKASDTTTADNGGSIRVDGAGRRWYALTKILNPWLFGADASGVADSTTAMTNLFTAAGSTMPVHIAPVAGLGGSIKTIAALTYNGPSLWMEPGTAIKPTGTGYTALVLTNGAFFACDQIYLTGPGGKNTIPGASPLDGLFLNNRAGLKSGIIRVQGFYGFGVRCNNLWDAEAYISVEDCGRDASGKYAFWIGSDNSDTSNEFHLTRLQVENSYAQAISFSSCQDYTVDELHSEGSVFVGGFQTYAIQGFRSKWDNPRIENPSSTPSVLLALNASEFCNPFIGSTCSLILECDSNGEFTMTTPNIGAFGGVLNNSGIITILGGVVGAYTSHGSTVVFRGSAVTFNAQVSYGGVQKASGSAVALTTNTPANVTSIALQPGTFELSGVVGFANNSNITYGSAGIGATSATLPAKDSGATVAASPMNGTGTDNVLGIPPVIVSHTVPTTYYLVGQCGFASGTVSAYGFLAYRRI